MVLIFRRVSKYWVSYFKDHNTTIQISSRKQTFKRLKTENITFLENWSKNWKFLELQECFQAFLLPLFGGKNSIFKTQSSIFYHFNNSYSIAIVEFSFLGHSEGALIIAKQNKP